MFPVTEKTAITVDKHVKCEEKENFHEFLRAETNKLTENIYQTKDKTFSQLNNLKKNENIVLLSGDKDSSTVIMDKNDYVNKVEDMIETGIQDGKYQRTEDATHKNLHNFQTFLYNNFRTHKQYQNMRPVSNQPGRFFATAKTHKFENYNDITVETLKLRPIIDQTGTHTPCSKNHI